MLGSTLPARLGLARMRALYSGGMNPMLALIAWASSTWVDIDIQIYLQNLSTNIRNSFGFDMVVKASDALCNSLPPKAVISPDRRSLWSRRHTTLSQATAYTHYSEMIKFEQVLKRLSTQRA